MRPAAALCALSLAASLAACSTTADPQPKACTTIGCVDGFTIDLSPNAGWPAGQYRFEVTVDGQATTCEGALPLPACDMRALTCTGAGDVMVSESGCALPAAQHGFASIMLKSKSAKQVKLLIARDSKALVDQQLTPAYQTSRPNGEGCEPVCTSAHTTVQVP